VVIEAESGILIADDEKVNEIKKLLQNLRQRISFKFSENTSELRE